MKKYTKAILFQNAGVGDFLMALFLAEQLKEQSITDDVRIVVHKGAGFLRGFMGEYPYVSLLEVSLRRPKSLLSLLSLFDARNLVVLPPTIGKFQLKTKFLAWLLAKPTGTLVGFQDSGALCEALYTKNIPYNIRQRFDTSILDIVRALGISGVHTPARLHIHAEDSIVDQLGLTGKKYVYLHPRGGSERRRLSTDEAKSVVDFILSTSPERFVLVSGAENERQAIEDITRTASDPVRVVQAVGASPEGLAALIQGAELFVGMDTGITHLACLLHKRSLVIAKNATANWLPYYNKNATIIYRFKEDEVSHTDEAYMWAHQKGRLRPFKEVSIRDVNAVLAKMLGVTG